MVLKHQVTLNIKPVIEYSIWRGISVTKMARMNVLADVVKGLKANVYAVDNLSPVSRVAVYIRAGSRYEPDAHPGITHYLRASAGLTTQTSSIFGITRHTERAGATLKVTSDREYIIYRVDCLRDKLNRVLGFIDDTIHKPEFRSWELVDVVQPRLKEELERFKRDQVMVANEALHKAAYRGGLAHSLFIPEHQIEKIKNDHLFEFVEKNYVLERMYFAGLGVDENELRDTVEENFRLNNSPFAGVVGASRYVGGEARIQAGFPHTMVNFVVQGSHETDLKKLAALEVISFLLGANQQTHVKYGQGPETSLSNLLNSYSPKFKSSIININHSDSGLFGFSIVGPNEHLYKATKASIAHFKRIVSGISEKDLSSARKATRARSLILSENQEAVFTAMGRRYAAGIANQSPLDQVETLKLSDVKATAESLLKSKPTIVSVGNPRFVPYVDELDSQIM